MGQNENSPSLNSLFEFLLQNYKYLQIINIQTNKDDIKIKVDNEKEIIYKFIKVNE